MSRNAQFAETLLRADAPIPTGLNDGQGRSATARFNVYRNNVAVSLTDALATSFPVVAQMVGDEFFRAMAGLALRDAPPSNPLMATFGSDFPDFLERFPPVAHLPYLADVARIENAVRRAYHAADVVAFGADDLAQMDEVSLLSTAFSQGPAVTLLRSDHPVATLWHNHQPDSCPAPLTGAEDILIARPEFDPVVVALPPGAYKVLAACDGETRFAEAIAAGGDTLDLASLLQIILTSGCLVQRKDA